MVQINIYGSEMGVEINRKVLQIWFKDSSEMVQRVRYGSEMGSEIV